ncbi:hypothetical protein [Thermococcus pacificus]|uniref:Uncharacterized protein n=1 Tax=Thermococcus pacificus TaxID=71998 RepID=A0A218P6N2_9EURY|nr:hypothetical protein [Thermococcus pacificus]ASJ06427.1 hypothetical protein A3L08_03310 [Thermococcus pacificus]
MKRRAFIFTLDAILSVFLALIIITSIIGIEAQTRNVYSTYMRSSDKYLAEDTLTMLKTVPLSDIVPQEKLSEWISSGVINTTLVDPHMSPLEITTTYWSMDAKYPSLRLREKAGEILSFILDTALKDYNYELIISTNNSSNVYNYERPYIIKSGSNYNLTPDVMPATLILSGYEYNKTPRGYMARAYLSKLKAKETTYTYMGDYIATANDNTGPIKIRYIVPTSQFPSDARITGVKWLLEGAWTYSDYSIRINDKYVTCRDWDNGGWNNVHLNEELEDTNDNDYTTCNLVEEVQNSVDQNINVTFQVLVKHSMNSGEDGAQHIIITYKTSQASTFTYPHKFYFADVYANDSLDMEKYVFAPGNISELRIHIEGENIEVVTARFRIFNKLSDPITLSRSGNVFTADNATIASAIQSTGYTYQDISGSFFTIIFDITRASSSELHLDGTKSYVYVGYTPFVYASLYSIDFRKTLDDYTARNRKSGDFYNDVTWQWSLPEKGTPIYVKYQFPWLHDAGTVCDQDVRILSKDETTWITLYDAPQHNDFLDVFTRWGYTVTTRDYQGRVVEDAIHPGLNKFDLSFGKCYGVDPSHALGEVLFLLDAYAPYKDIKPKLLQGYPEVKAYNLTYKYIVGSTVRESSIIIGDKAAVSRGEYMNLTAAELKPGDYAVDDAVLRLFQKLGGDGWNHPILVELSDTKIDFASLGGIPSSISPIMVTLRVWRENS